VTLLPATWWISSTLGLDGEEGGPDYIVRLPDGVEDEKLAIGLIALAIAALGIAVLVYSIRAGLIRRRWLGVVIPISAMTTYLGFTLRIISTPVFGANIGGALLSSFAFPIVVGLGTASGVTAYRLLRPANAE
jgi:hypothetical protein